MLKLKKKKDTRSQSTRDGLIRHRDKRNYQKTIGK